METVVGFVFYLKKKRKKGSDYSGVATKKKKKEMLCQMAAFVKQSEVRREVEGDKATVHQKCENMIKIPSALFHQHWIRRQLW